MNVDNPQDIIHHHVELRTRKWILQELKAWELEKKWYFIDSWLSGNENICKGWCKQVAKYDGLKYGKKFKGPLIKKLFEFIRYTLKK